MPLPLPKLPKSKPLSLEIESTSAKQTEKLGQKFAKLLRGGEVIALIGNLGSGKTTFVKGLARGLGIKKPVVSPTFIITQSYPIKRGSSLHHFDLYRLEGRADLGELGLQEFLGDPRHIVAIEWPDLGKHFLPIGTIFVKFVYGKTLNARHIIFSQ